MNTVEYYTRLGGHLQAPYALFAKDMNLDGNFTITDCWEWIKHLFFLIGDTIQFGIYKYVPPLADFLEIGWDSYHGWASGIMGFFIWPSLLTLIGIVLVALNSRGTYSEPDE